MPFYYNIPFFLIMIPMVASIIMPLLRKGNMAKTVCVVLQLVSAVLSAILLACLWGSDNQYFTYAMGHFPAPFGNELRAGPLEAMMSLTFAVVMIFAILGGSADTVRDIKKGKVHLFYLMIGLLSTSLMALVYTNDIFTAYVFIEINTIAACAIVVAKENGETVRATVKYLVMSVLGSGLFLLATSMLYGLTGHLLMENAHERVAALAATGEYHLPLIVTLGLFAVSIAVKCALFPFHTWLPDAYSTATTTSSAVQSGLINKGYILLFMKLVYRVYGFDVIQQLGVLQIMFVLGLAGMIVGSIVAFTQTDMRRMIAYSSIAQVGYIFLGIGLGTDYGFTAASFQIMAHAFTKSMLFIAAASLINTAGTSVIRDMSGAGKKNKIAGIAFVVGSLSMIGIPLLAGFVSKFYLATAASEGAYGTWVALIVLALSTFLNALYYIPVMLRIYSDKKPTVPASSLKPVTDTTGRGTIAATLGFLIVINIALGIFFTPIMEVIADGFRMLG